MGVMGPGKSMKTAVVRLAAILMATAHGLAEHDEAAADPYRTLVAYFNSLRELGGAVRLMDCVRTSGSPLSDATSTAPVARSRCSGESQTVA